MTEFTDYLTDVFSGFGHVNTKQMFGGHGLYHDGVMFGIVINELLYLKADASISRYFEMRELCQFEYMRRDKAIKLSYYLAPEEIYDDFDEATIWARRSFEVAFRNKKSWK
jgi:DNA transformation protein